MQCQNTVSFIKPYLFIVFDVDGDAMRMFSRGKLMLQAALKKNAQNGGTGIVCY